MSGMPQAWWNWAGNVSARPRRVLTPRSPGEVAAAITQAGLDNLTVRMTGSGHSFTRPPSRAPSRPAPTAAAVTWEARRDWRISFPVEVRVLGP